eukprot:GHVQ01013583.1.p1 GENE.GHVQ01013583.1~~GHVQ01013583.1.p1  ORF type:complete len:1657 (-),score=176.44 GHVQ01013583.1:1335-6305(-)
MGNANYKDFEVVPEAVCCTQLSLGVLESVVNRVRNNVNGSLRMSRWQLLSIIGHDKLLHITQLFSLFSDCTGNHSSISGIQLSVGLVLINEPLDCDKKLQYIVNSLCWKPRNEKQLTRSSMILLSQTVFDTFRRFKRRIAKIECTQEASKETAMQIATETKQRLSKDFSKLESQIQSSFAQDEQLTADELESWVKDQPCIWERFTEICSPKSNNIGQHEEEQELQSTPMSTQSDVHEPQAAMMELQLTNPRQTHAPRSLAHRNSARKQSELVRTLPLFRFNPHCLFQFQAFLCHLRKSLLEKHQSIELLRAASSINLNPLEHPVHLLLCRWMGSSFLDVCRLSDSAALSIIPEESKSDNSSSEPPVVAIAHSSYSMLKQQLYADCNRYTVSRLWKETQHPWASSDTRQYAIVVEELNKLKDAAERQPDQFSTTVSSCYSSCWVPSFRIGRRVLQLRTKLLAVLRRIFALRETYALPKKHLKRMFQRLRGATEFWRNVKVKDGDLVDASLREDITNLEKRWKEPYDTAKQEARDLRTRISCLLLVEKTFAEENRLDAAINNTKEHYRSMENSMYGTCCDARTIKNIYKCAKTCLRMSEGACAAIKSEITGGSFTGRLRVYDSKTRLDRAFESFDCFRNHHGGSHHGASNSVSNSSCEPGAQDCTSVVISRINSIDNSTTPADNGDVDKAPTANESRSGGCSLKKAHDMVSEAMLAGPEEATLGNVFQATVCHHKGSRSSLKSSLEFLLNALLVIQMRFAKSNYRVLSTDSTLTDPQMPLLEQHVNCLVENAELASPTPAECQQPCSEYIVDGGRELEELSPSERLANDVTKVCLDQSPTWILESQSPAAQLDSSGKNWIPCSSQAKQSRNGMDSAVPSRSLKLAGLLVGRLMSSFSSAPDPSNSEIAAATTASELRAVPADAYKDNMATNPASLNGSSSVLCDKCTLQHYWSRLSSTEKCLLEQGDGADCFLIHTRALKMQIQSAAHSVEPSTKPDTRIDFTTAQLCLETVLSRADSLSQAIAILSEALIGFYTNGIETSGFLFECEADRPGASMDSHNRLTHDPTAQERNASPSTGCPNNHEDTSEDIAETKTRPPAADAAHVEDEISEGKQECCCDEASDELNHFAKHDSESNNCSSSFRELLDLFEKQPIEWEVAIEKLTAMMKDDEANQNYLTAGQTRNEIGDEGIHVEHTPIKDGESTVTKTENKLEDTQAEFSENTSKQEDDGNTSDAGNPELESSKENVVAEDHFGKTDESEGNNSEVTGEAVMATSARTINSLPNVETEQCASSAEDEVSDAPVLFCYDDSPATNFINATVGEMVGCDLWNSAGVSKTAQADVIGSKAAFLLAEHKAEMLTIQRWTENWIILLEGKPILDDMAKLMHLVGSLHTCVRDLFAQDSEEFCAELETDHYISSLPTYRGIALSVKSERGGVDTSAVVSATPITSQDCRAHIDNAAPTILRFSQLLPLIANSLAELVAPYSCPREKTSSASETALQNSDTSSTACLDALASVVPPSPRRERIVSALGLLHTQLQSWAHRSSTALEFTEILGSLLPGAHASLRKQDAGVGEPIFQRTLDYTTAFRLWVRCRVRLSVISALIHGRENIRQIQTTCAAKATKRMLSRVWQTKLLEVQVRSSVTVFDEFKTRLSLCVD